MQVWLFPPEVKQAGNRHSDEQRLNEGGEVDQHQHVGGRQHHQGDQAQRDQAGYGGEVGDVQQGHQPRHVPVSSTNKEQPG